MFKSIRKTLAVATAGAMLSFSGAVALTPAGAYAQPNIEECLQQGTDLRATINGQCNPGAVGDSGQTVQEIVTLVVNIFSIVVGIIAVIMIIWGGLKYITSGGDSTKITSAKNTIIYAIIGLVIVALAQFIVRFVLDAVTGL